MGSLNPTTHNVWHPGEDKGKFSGGHHGTRNGEKNYWIGGSTKGTVRVRETAVIPQRSIQGSIGYDISAIYSYVIPTKGKGVVQTGLAISLPSGVYAKMAPRWGLAYKKFIDVGVGVISSDYWGEIWVVLFNHPAVDFPIQVGDKIAQLILETIKTPIVRKVIVVSATNRGSGGFGSAGLQCSDPSVSIKQKENWAEKMEKIQKREY